MIDLFTSPDRFVDRAGWHEQVERLRANGPVHRVEANGFEPFWAVLDHAVIMDIERQPELFHSAPRPVLWRTRDQAKQNEVRAKTLVHMDPPEHQKHRSLYSDWFKPGNLRRLEDRLDELSRQTLQKLAALGGSCDFRTDVAIWYPLQVILDILGLPADDYPRMMQLTQEFFGPEDSDLQREEGFTDTTAVLREFASYFSQLAARRRTDPTDDLASVIANGRIDDEPMKPSLTAGHYLTLVTAGHDTTASCMSGGLGALIEHPEQLQLLRHDPGLLGNAVEEMIRHTSPVRAFMRTATADTDLAGTPVEAGAWIYLSYLAANFDPKVFEDPYRFDIQRPNASRHLAFGFGPHFCLGAQLARMELRSLFRHLVPALDSIEFAGEASMVRSFFVGGHKSLPIRYSLKE